MEQAALAGESLQSITQAVNSINEMNILIASAAEEQSSVEDEISGNVVNINDLTTESVGATQKISHESQSLSDLAQRLQDLVSQFKTA